MNTSQSPDLGLDLPPGVHWDLERADFIARRLSVGPQGETRLLESILTWDNIQHAIKRVKANAGKPGVDGMKVGELPGYFRRHWSKIREAILSGRHRPLPVRRVEIPKPDGGVRLLGIPSCVDRVIQQACSQVLHCIWDHTFSDHSFGFRPGRCQHDAIERVCAHLDQGHTWVVDVDLSKFFDRVCHDRLLSRLATRIQDARVLNLIRLYLKSGILIGGLVEPSDEGTPQGGPLSPLLSNIVLDELDKELEQRGLAFVRYADDFVIFVGSERAGARVLRSVGRFISRRLKLQVNETKSQVVRLWTLRYLGFSFLPRSDKHPRTRVRLSPKSVKRLKARLRELTGRNCGRSIVRVVADLNEYLRGWWGYFRIIESTNRLRGVAGWIFRRLRSLLWTQWKTPRMRVRRLLELGLSPAYAACTGNSRKGPWRISGLSWVRIPMSSRYFARLGLRIPWL